MTEGTLAAWLCDDGVEVAAGQPLYRLETDKVTMDIEAPAAGILRQLVPAGTDVPVGHLIGRLLAPGESDITPSPSAEGEGRGEGFPIAAAKDPLPSPLPREGEGIRATPAARRLARDLGVNLAAVAARTGGMVREDDVRDYAEER